MSEEGSKTRKQGNVPGDNRSPRDCSPAAGSARRFVRMFKPQFAAAVEAGEKCQTIRPTPKRMPEAGDLISLRCWTEKPYRSKQRELREATITKVLPITIEESKILLCGLEIHTTPDEFAVRDGFKDWPEMRQWFADTHGLPFSGVLICWRNDQIQQPKQ